MNTEPNKSHFPLHEEMIQLKEKWLNGDQKAFDRAIVGNLGLVKTIAGKIFPFNTPDWEDAIQEGVIGMMMAFEKWEPKTASFSTYASFWIKQKIRLNSYNKTKTIRLPIHTQSKNKKLRFAMGLMQGDLGRSPTLAEVSDELGISETRIHKILAQNNPTASLDAPTFVSNDGEHSYYDFVEDENTRSPQQLATLKDECLLAAKMMKELYDYLATRMKNGLAGKDCRIFFTRYGIYGYGPARTLEETAKPYGITRERVRQICLKIFVKRANRGLVPHNEGSLEELVNSIQTGVELMNSMDEEVPEEVMWVIRNH